jgi:alpha-L-fucosidase
LEKEANHLPALSCLPINRSWFWKTYFPREAVKDPVKIVNDNIIPLNQAYCNFILNVAPNREGLIDDNALLALQKIGKLWKNSGPVSKIPVHDAPIISSNIAKERPAYSSWSDDMWIMDFANDDNFETSWISHPTVQRPWFEVDLGKESPFNTISICEDKKRIKVYTLSYYNEGKWNTIYSGPSRGNINIHRFDPLWGSRIKITIDAFDEPPAIAEFGVYNERR